MAACRDYDELLTLHAAGALEADEEARVRAHLASCAGCREEAASTAAVLGRLELPAPTPREEAVAELLPRRALAGWRREQVRKAARMQWVGSLLAAAAVVMLVLVPSLQRRGSVKAERPVATLAPEPSEPLDEVLESFDAWATSNPLAEVIDATDLEASGLASAFDVAGLLAGDAFDEDDFDEDVFWDSYLGEML